MVTASLPHASRLSRLSTATIDGLIAGLCAERRRLEARAHQHSDAARIVANLELELQPLVAERRRRETGVAA